MLQQRELRSAKCIAAPAAQVCGEHTWRGYCYELDVGSMSLIRWCARMHELSIAMSLVDVASEEARRLGNARVTALHLRIGPLSGVVADALTFSFSLAAEGSLVADARLVIEEPPIVAHCASCDTDRTIPSAQSLCCPICFAPVMSLISGREMELVGLEIEDSPTAPAADPAHVAAHR